MGGQVLAESFVENLVSKFSYKNRDVIELVVRRKDGKIGKILKVAAKDLSNSGNGDQLASVAMSAIKKTNKGLADVRKEMNALNNGMSALTSITKDMASEVSGIFSMTQSVQMLSYLNVGLSMANIAVDIAGFAIIAAKLNDLSKEVQAIDAKLDKVVDANKHEKIAEFQKLIMSFNSMSDSIRDNSNVNMSKLEDLISEMRAFISEMLRDLQDGVFEEEVLLNIINTLMPAYTILFCEHLDRYYFEKQAVPSNYPIWICLYEELASSNFKQRLEDYYFFEEGMHHIDAVDAVNAQILLGLNGRVQVEDQLEILKTFKTREAVEEFDKQLDEVVQQEVQEAVPEMAKIFNVGEDKCREALRLGA